MRFNNILPLSMAMLIAGAGHVRFSDPVMHGYAPVPTKRIKTGEKYPHSSARQRSRYGRQIAAGQIKNAA